MSGPTCMQSRIQSGAQAKMVISTRPSLVACLLLGILEEGLTVHHVVIRHCSWVRQLIDAPTTAVTAVAGHQ